MWKESFHIFIMIRFMIQTTFSTFYFNQAHDVFSPAIIYTLLSSIMDAITNSIRCQTNLIPFTQSLEDLRGTK